MSEALRLADALAKLHASKKYHPSGPGGQMCGSEQYRLVTSGLAFEALQDAAAELRRQNALIVEMREALIAVNIQLVNAQRFARAAIAKAEEQT